MFCVLRTQLCGLRAIIEMTHEEETLAVIVEQGAVQVLTGLLTNDATSGDAQVRAGTLQRGWACATSVCTCASHARAAVTLAAPHLATAQLVAAVLFFMYSVCLVPQYKSQVLSAGALSSILASYSRHVDDVDVVATFRDIVEVCWHQPVCSAPCSVLLLTLGPMLRADAGACR